MAEPITLDEAKAHLRIVDDDSEDDVIDAAIVDARGWVEDYTGLILVRRTVVEGLRSFNDRLRAWPIVSITDVSYIDLNGVSQTVDTGDYIAQITRRPAALSRLSGCWPSMLTGTPVDVTMTAGFADGMAVEQFSPNLMRAMRLLIGGFYADRETGGLADEVETAARRLCRNFKKWAL